MDLGSVGLRSISLKEEYRSDRDDIVAEFFVPCLCNCVGYDRCIEYMSLKGLTTLALGLDSFVGRRARMRVVTGHRFSAYDLDMISRLFGAENIFRKGNIKDAKIRVLKQMADDGKLEMKVAIPNSEDVAGSFTEKIGVFTDEEGDAVAFTGTSNETFDTTDRNFESIDVFTSWNDRSRVETKIRDFEDLWGNNTRYLEVRSFEDASRLNLVRYSSRWAIGD